MASVSDASATVSRSPRGNRAPKLPSPSGGSIPLQVGRLGGRPIANGYNPVAYLILRATCELPQKVRQAGTAQRRMWIGIIGRNHRKDGEGNDLSVGRFGRGRDMREKVVDPGETRGLVRHRDAAHARPAVWSVHPCPGRDACALRCSSHAVFHDPAEV